MIEQAIRSRVRPVIPYVTAGLPDMDATFGILKALEDSGAAAIEIGIPFSDPLADGPVLQKASTLALQAGFTLSELMRRLPSWSAGIDVPLIVMTYINPLMRRGLVDSLKGLREAGVKGVIIPDLPVDASDIYGHCSAIGLDLIRLVAPTTKEDRAREVLSQCGGFVYAVAVKGVTGMRSALSDGLRGQVELVRACTDLPVCVGFGVSSASQVSDLLTFADGVIVGSLLMRRIMDSEDPVATAHNTLKNLLGGS
jgi:tryptophan synthase alpha chain